MQVVWRIVKVSTGYLIPLECNCTFDSIASGEQSRTLYEKTSEVHGDYSNTA